MCKVPIYKNDLGKLGDPECQPSSYLIIRKSTAGKVCRDFKCRSNFRECIGAHIYFVYGLTLFAAVLFIGRIRRVPLEDGVVADAA